LEGTIIRHNLDFNWDGLGHDQPVDQDGNLIRAFDSKNIQYWKRDGLYVVTGFALCFGKQGVGFCIPALPVS
jgi:hypothetical protein